MDLAKLFRTHNRALVRFCVKHFRSDGEDIASETWVKIVRNIDKYDPSKDFEGWMFTIARRTGMDAHRRRARRPVVSTDVHQLSADLTDPTVRNHSDVLADLEVAQLGLQQCSPKTHEVIGLIAEGYTQPEIAAKLGVPVTTVKGRLERRKDQRAL